MITYRKFNNVTNPVKSTKHLKLKLAALTMLALSGAGFFTQLQHPIAHAATVNSQVIYTVKAGDTLSKIASQYQVSVSQLKTWNQLDGDLILVGQKLQVQNNGLAVNNDNQSIGYQSRVLYSASKLTSASVNSAASLSVTNNSANAQNTTTSSNTATTTTSLNTMTSSDSSAQAWIANKESGGSYTAQNGRYYGKYQLDKNYLNGDYSVSNQEKVAQQYMKSRYGTWSNAKQHWLTNGWW